METYTKEVKTVDELKGSYMESIATTIKILKERNLESAVVEFEFMGAEVKALIKVKKSKIIS